MIQSEMYILVTGKLDMVKLCLKNKARFVSGAHDLLGRKHSSLLLTDNLSYFRKEIVRSLISGDTHDTQVSGLEEVTRVTCSDFPQIFIFIFMLVLHRAYRLLTQFNLSNHSEINFLFMDKICYSVPCNTCQVMYGDSN